MYDHIARRNNDIVRGEYTGQVIYKRNDIITSTESDENRLKVLYYWLSKNQRRMIDYSDDFFQKVYKVLTGYLFSPEKDDIFASLRELHLEVCSKLGYIQQARRVRVLEEVRNRRYRGEPISYRRMVQLALEVTQDLKYEVVNFFPQIVENVIACLEHITSNRYLINRYVRHHENKSKAASEVRKGYGALVAATDDFRKVLRNRTGFKPSSVLQDQQARQASNRQQDAARTETA